LGFVGFGSGVTYDNKSSKEAYISETVWYKRFVMVDLLLLTRGPRRVMIRLEGTRRGLYVLGESKAVTSEVHVSLDSEPFGRWPTRRNRLVCVNVNSEELKNF